MMMMTIMMMMICTHSCLILPSVNQSMAANGSCAEGSSRARFGLLALMLMMMRILFVSAVNWKRSPSLPARAGLAFGAASRSYTLIQDDGTTPSGIKPYIHTLATYM